MRLIRFIQMGTSISNNTTINNLVYTLNSIQSQFRFLFDNDIILYPNGTDIEKPISTERLNIMTREYVSNKYPNEYPVAICDCRLEDELFTECDDREALISTFGWEDMISSHSVERGIAYALADILLNLYITLPVHHKTKGCPTDFCNIPGDIKIGLFNCEYCTDCQSKILRAIAQGQITLQQVVAIYKILDFVAERKICFVIMPFDEKADQIYNKCIKPTLIDNGWECRRADEIHEAREIINLVWEQILRADLIIADLTAKNANVFYELGYAHAVGKNTILVTQSINETPFDLRHRQLIKYSTTSRGLKNLAKAITQYL
jgi:hypothetical protein